MPPLLSVLRRCSVVVDFLFIVTPIVVGVCNCSMFCSMLLNVHSSIAINLMGKRELVALLNLSSWCLVVVALLFLAVPWGCLRFVIVVFPDHTRLLFLVCNVSVPGSCLRFLLTNNSFRLITYNTGLDMLYFRRVLKPKP